MHSERVLYKGKPYLLQWSGKTKFGQRAKLSYLDGSHVFWVDASAISLDSHSRAGNSSRRCRECRGPLVDDPAHPAMGGLCGRCAFDEYDM